MRPSTNSSIGWSSGFGREGERLLDEALGLGEVAGHVLDDREQHPRPPAALRVLLGVALHGLLEELARVLDVLLLEEVVAEADQGRGVVGVALQGLLPGHHPLRDVGATSSVRGNWPGPWKP